MSMSFFFGLALGALAASVIASCVVGSSKGDDHEQEIRVALGAMWSTTAVLVVLSIIFAGTVANHGYPENDDDPRPTPTSLGR